MEINSNSRGSKWRKWDLHFHTPSSYDYADLSIDNGAIIKALKDNDVSAVAITDHNVIDSDRIKKLQELAGGDLTIFPGIELKSNLGGSDLVHFTGIFPEKNINLEDLKKEIEVRLKLKESDLSILGNGDIKEGHKKHFCEIGEILKTIKDLGGLVAVHAGSKSNSYEKLKEVLKNHYISKIDILEIGVENDISDYINIVFPDIKKHLPMIICSDNHNVKDYLFKSNCWIKADPTFEGLKQIIFEPEQGERVFIGQSEPDKKDKYKVIDKIIFDVGCKFPEEIKFNNNLCSIIGSRSSGKSALLAYVAHGIDKEFTESRMPDGPGAGISWGDVDFSYKVQWSNGLENEKSLGKIVYIPQNYLFRISSQPDEIKEKIEPVLFNLLPDFKNRYVASLEAIKNHNINIENTINSWFLNADKIKNIAEQTKSFGDKSAIEKEVKSLEANIEEIKKKFSLTEEDIKKYQNINNSLKRKEGRTRVINSELIQILSQLESQTEDSSNFFKKVILDFNPSLDNLSEILRKRILNKITEYENIILDQVNLIVKDYGEELEKELVQLKEDTEKEKISNKELIERNEKNNELRELIEGLNNQNILIEKINNLDKLKNEILAIQQINEKAIKVEVQKRKSVLDRLFSYLKSLNQDSFDIVFGIECEVDIIFQDALIKKINKLETSDFFDKGKLKLNEIRNNPIQFITKIYSGEQKINSGYDKKDVVKDVLTLTEKILFTAEMEGDKIGGFKKSTMTAGKQALFALKLILGESEDKWPLLIDQPEDDLDSRSIYDHIVPFLKKKKKERQIIMVSHNANLVIGSDSEQIIVSNRNGDDRPNEDGKEFNYFSGSIENTEGKNIEKEKIDILKSQGIREHSCDVLDGGEIAFEHRRDKYNLKSK